MRRALRIGAVVVGVLLLIGLVLPLFVNANTFRPKLESELSSALGREVKIGNLSLSMFSGTVSADNIAVADDPAFSKGPFITANRFKAGVEILPLIFSKTLHVTGISLAEPQITLLRGQNGTWNFSTIGSGAAKASPKPAESSGNALSVDKIKVEGGRVLVGRANSAEKPRVYDPVNLDVQDFSATSQFPFTMTAALPGGGDMSLKGKYGPINASTMAAAPLTASLKVRRLDLAASGFTSSSSGIQGVADLDGNIDSDGQVAKIGGDLKAENVKLVAKGAPSRRPFAVKCSIEHNLKTDAGRLTLGDVSIGKALAHLTGSYQTEERSTALNFKLSGHEMPVDEIEAALPAVGVVLPAGSKLQGGGISVDLGIAGTAEAPVITGPIRLSNAKLAGFDLGSKLSAIPALSGKSGGQDTVIQNLSTTLHMAPEGTQARDINLTIPSLGVVTGAGTVSPSGALNFAMNANLSEKAVGGLVQKTGIGGHGGDIPFGIEGTLTDPKFVPNVKAMAENAVKETISGKISGAKVANPVGAIAGRFGKKK